MNAADVKKPLAADLRYYLPRWLIFGVVAGLLGAVLTPTVSGEHMVLWGSLLLGVVYGLLSGAVFVGLQRTLNLNGSRLKWWLNAFASTIAAKLVLVAVTPLVQQVYLQHGGLDTIEAHAKKDFPAATYTESVKREAEKLQEQSLTAANSDSEKQEYAAENFFGFYFMSVRVRSAYCRNLGVDISPFVDGFKRVNKDSYDRAKIILARSNVTEDQLSAQMWPQLMEFNDKNMADVAAIQKMTTVQLCERTRDDPEPKVMQLTFSKANPAAYEILSHVH